jgi:hypothetical protein
MSGVSIGSPRRSPRLVALEHMRTMKDTLARLIKPLAEPRTELVETGGTRRRRDPVTLAEHSAEYWMGVWRAAQQLRIQADQLAAHASQQAKLARIRNHPANQHPTPEENP